MSDEHVKLVAKIQHFYDLMLRKLQDLENDSLSCNNDIEYLGYKEKSVAIKLLSVEYAKTFDDFLYKQT